jgi:DNA-binding CsgD family transcriptional regulator
MANNGSVPAVRTNLRGWPPLASDAGPTGLILSDVTLKPIYINVTALEILAYPERPESLADPVLYVRERLRSIVPEHPFAGGSSAIDLLSGRRRYRARRFVVDSQDPRLLSSIMAIVLERTNEHAAASLMSDAARRFHLSPRERETVQHLVLGLTTKEVAERMGVSPNTVKQFVRLVMSKMGVTTRSGMIGKLIHAC